MKFITIDEIPGRVPSLHYDLLSRAVADESLGVKAFKVSYTRMEKNGRCEPHVHANGEQLLIVLKGAMMFVSKEGERPLGQGQAVLVLRAEEHSNYNIADDVTEYITVTAKA
ncbi:MAG: cupin domain-containing protein [Proteobacteria bacterium]|nr:cupin domain-containing protein [Pseudomonadota bacterium]